MVVITEVEHFILDMINQICFIMIVGFVVSSSAPYIQLMSPLGPGLFSLFVNLPLWPSIIHKCNRLSNFI